jgi:hypothetical protein
VTWKNAHLVRELDASEIESMKQGPGKDMIILRGVSRLPRQRPAVVRGIEKSVKLELLEATKYASGDVLLRYARK